MRKTKCSRMTHNHFDLQNLRIKYQCSCCRNREADHLNLPIDIHTCYITQEEEMPHNQYCQNIHGKNRIFQYFLLN